MGLELMEEVVDGCCPPPLGNADCISSITLLLVRRGNNPNRCDSSNPGLAASCKAFQDLRGDLKIAPVNRNLPGQVRHNNPKRCFFAFKKDFEKKFEIDDTLILCRHVHNNPNRPV